VTATTLEELRALLEKYDLLLALHAGEPGRTVERRDAMRAIAARFPGALREWDQLPKPVLSSRRARVAALISAVETAGGEPLPVDAEPWLRYSLELHGALRSLLVRRRSQAIEPGRRLSEAAYVEIAVRHGVTVAAVKQAIFESESESTEADD
jgi:hypothetical protein